jgi:hypothetical protein
MSAVSKEFDWARSYTGDKSTFYLDYLSKLAQALYAGKENLDSEFARACAHLKTSDIKTESKTETKPALAYSERIAA